MLFSVFMSFSFLFSVVHWTDFLQEKWNQNCGRFPSQCLKKRTWVVILIQILCSAWDKDSFLFHKRKIFLVYVEMQSLGPFLWQWCGRQHGWLWIERELKLCSVQFVLSPSLEDHLVVSPKTRQTKFVFLLIQDQKIDCSKNDICVSLMQRLWPECHD